MKYILIIIKATYFCWLDRWNRSDSGYIIVSSLEVLHHKSIRTIKEIETCFRCFWEIEFSLYIKYSIRVYHHLTSHKDITSIPVEYIDGWNWSCSNHRMYHNQILLEWSNEVIVTKWLHYLYKVRFWYGVTPLKYCSLLSIFPDKRNSIGSFVFSDKFVMNSYCEISNTNVSFFCFNSVSASELNHLFALRQDTINKISINRNILHLESCIKVFIEEL